jgi:hypothetical protein
VRTMARISFPVEAGNRAIQDGTLPKLIGEMTERWKPEATYFTTFEGLRTAYVVFDLPDSSGIPVFAEPFFTGLQAQIELAPVMNAEDLQKGLSSLA